MATFLQPEQYYTGFHVLVLTPKKEMQTDELLFYTMCIRKNKYKYNYGRQANKTLKDILIPTEMPRDFQYVSLNKIPIPSDKTLFQKHLELNKIIRVYPYQNLFFSVPQWLCGKNQNPTSTPARKFIPSVWNPPISL